MATYTKTYTLTITSGSPSGDTVYSAIDKLEDNIDQIITDLNNAHMTTNGDIIYRAAGASTRLAIGTDNYVLTSTGTAPNWELIPYSTHTERRAVFSYASDSVITIHPGAYWCYDKYCKWGTAGDVTSTQIASGSPVAKDWYYLYLDYSEITSETELVAAKFIWSTTEPTWNDTPGYHGWYNGYDRCIFAVVGNAGGTDIVPFYHDGGDLVLYEDIIAGGQTSKTAYDFSSIDVDTTWTDVYLQIPSFCTKALCTFNANYGAPQGNATIGILYWRTNAQSGTVGHTGAQSYYAPAGTVVFFQGSNTSPVLTDSAGIIEVKHGVSDTNTASIAADGYYFPVGM